MEGEYNNDKIDIIKSLSKTDLLLLSAYVDSQNKSIQDIYWRFGNKLKKDFHDHLGKDIVMHRLRYLEMIGLLKSESGGNKGKFFRSEFGDEELSGELRKLGINLEEHYYSNNKNEMGKEAVEKLGLLLEEDVQHTKGVKYLIHKK